MEALRNKAKAALSKDEFALFLVFVACALTSQHLMTYELITHCAQTRIANVNLNDY